MTKPDPTALRILLVEDHHVTRLGLRALLDGVGRFRVVGEVGTVAEGKTNKQIGMEMGLSDKTIKNYLSNALDKLKLSRRSQAAALFATAERSKPSYPSWPERPPEERGPS